LKALEIIKEKIIDQDELKWVLNRWRFKGEKIVFTNGCFDILHQGHIDYLSKAKDLGSKLVIGLNSNESVQRLNKADNRPLQDENSRSIILAALHFVDLVVIFNEETPLELIKKTMPDILVKGNDYQIHEIVGHKEVQANGGEVKTIDFLTGFSTTSIIEKACK
jgi:rfaE bifunctional protein nucleotidyltransferase chain/domain